MAKTPQVGEQAPDFELPGTDGTFRLSEHRGERVVLLFYPGDNTPVCTKQFCSYRDRADDFASLNATVVGISAQDLDSHEAFVAKNSLNVPLLADVGGEVAGEVQRLRPSRRQARGDRDRRGRGSSVTATITGWGWTSSRSTS